MCLLLLTYLNKANSNNFKKMHPEFVISWSLHPFQTGQYNYLHFMGDYLPFNGGTTKAQEKELTCSDSQ